MSLKISYIQLLILPIILWNQYAYGQDWLKDTCELNGAVKSVKYKSKGGAMPSKQTYEYNRQGFLVNWDGYWTGFFAGHNGKYRTFDESGTHCLKDSRAYDKIISQYYDMYYNENGKLEKQILTSDGDHWSTYNYLYDQHGKLIEEFVVIQSDLDTHYRYFEYDSEGRIVKDSDFKEKSKEIKSWKYDENGILLEEKLLDTSWTSETYNEQDENGNWVVVKRIDYSEEPNTSDSYIKHYTHNEQGQVRSEVRTNIEGVLLAEYFYTYNEQGDCLTKKIFWLEESETRIYSYFYEYDENGNWVTKVTKLDGELNEEEKRKIKYY